MKFLAIGFCALAFAQGAAASPCADRIAKLQARFDAAAPAQGAKPLDAPSAPTTADAKLHRQPSAASVGDANASADSPTTLKHARFQNDIFRAQAAENAGDISECMAAASDAEKDLAP
jgi:hypothetical protein